LQKEILEEDWPILRRIWFRDPHAAAVKYQQNVLTQRRLDQTRDTLFNHTLMAIHGGNDKEPVPLTNTFRHVNRVKLRHDAEQLDLLVSRGRLPAEPFSHLADLHRELIQQLPAASSPERLKVFNLPPQLPSEKTLFSRSFNRATNVFWPPRINSSTLTRNQLEWEKVQQKFYDASLPVEDDACNSQNGIAVVDNVLSNETLNELIRWCEESTMWFDSRAGYLGAFFYEAFNAPLLLQVAEELRAALPNILGQHPLSMTWAFKYSNEPEDWPAQGIDVHADEAAVNLNMWLSQDEANEDMGNGGGITIWTKQAPRQWARSQYNRHGVSADLNDFLKDSERIEVPHQQNRMVIFNSNLFHATQSPRFKRGYTNRRINLTMLFGKRRCGHGGESKIAEVQDDL